jgi:transposase, IS5 family
MKQDGHLERSALKGADGDVINVLLCAIGHNLRLLLAWFRKLLLLFLAAIWFSSSAEHMRAA